MTDADFSLSQGTFESLSWQGRPLIKTVYDFYLLPKLIAEIKPATIIELGSGSGASAKWLFDSSLQAASEAFVVSYDRLPPSPVDGPEFHYGDLETLRFDGPDWKTLKRPWLVVEDANSNTSGILDYLKDFLQTGDYLFLEDSAVKRSALLSFIADTGDRFLVDSDYTDFFGYNVTSAVNSILRCMA